MRLIDAEAFVKELKKFLITIHQTYLAEAVLRIVQKVIDKQPTIETKPVVHAHWEYIGESDGKKIYRCTNCQALLSGTGNFCKECGAQKKRRLSLEKNRKIL